MIAFSLSFVATLHQSIASSANLVFGQAQNGIRIAISENRKKQNDVNYVELVIATQNVGTTILQLSHAVLTHISLTGPDGTVISTAEGPCPSGGSAVPSDVTPHPFSMALAPGAVRLENEEGLLCYASSPGRYSVSLTMAFYSPDDTFSTNAIATVTSNTLSFRMP